MRPEQVKVAITRSDGGLTIIAFVTKSFYPDGSVEFERAASIANVNAEIAKARLDSVSWRIVPDNEVPADRTFRDAWKDAGQIAVDMPKARAIQRARISKARDAALPVINAELIDALQTKNATEQARATAKKTALNNVTADPRIDAASTPEALKALPDLVGEALNAAPGAVVPEPVVVQLAPATIASFASVAGAAFSYQNLAVPGLLATDTILRAWFSADFAPATITYEAERVVGANTLRMRFQKITSGSATPSSNQVLNVLVRR
jgi:hypothetical protein